MGDYSRWSHGLSYNYGVDDSRKSIQFKRPIDKAFEFQTKGPDDIDIMKSDYRGIKGVSPVQPLMDRHMHSSLQRKRSPGNVHSSVVTHGSGRKKSDSIVDQSQHVSKAQMRNVLVDMNMYTAKLPEERDLVKSVHKPAVKKNVAEEFSDIFMLSARLPRESRMEVTHHHVGFNAETDEQPLEMLEDEQRHTAKEYENELLRGSVGKSILSGSNLSPDSYRKGMQNIPMSISTQYSPILVFAEGEGDAQSKKQGEGRVYDKGNANSQAVKKDDSPLDPNTSRREQQGAIIHEVGADQEHEEQRQLSNSQLGYQTETGFTGSQVPLRRKPEAEKRSGFTAPEEDKQFESRPYGTASINLNTGQIASSQYNYQPRGQYTSQGQYSSPQQETRATTGVITSVTKQQNNVPLSGTAQVDESGRIGPFESTAGQVFVKITHVQSTPGTQETSNQPQAQSTYQSPHREVSQFTIQNQQPQQGSIQAGSENNTAQPITSQSEYRKPQYEYKSYQSKYLQPQAGQQQANVEQQSKVGEDTITQPANQKPKYDLKITISQGQSRPYQPQTYKPTEYKPYTATSYQPYNKRT